MDKMREDEIVEIFTSIVRKHPESDVEFDGPLPDDMRFIPIEFWQAATAAEQAKIDVLKAEDEISEGLLKHAQQTITEQAAKIAELEARIKESQEQEPVGEVQRYAMLGEDASPHPCFNQHGIDTLLEGDLIYAAPIIKDKP